MTDFIHVPPASEDLTVNKGGSNGQQAAAVAQEAEAAPQMALPMEKAIVRPVEKSASGKMGKGKSALSAQLSTMMGDAPFCNDCGHTTVRNGSCYRCLNCGNSMGCS